MQSRLQCCIRGAKFARAAGLHSIISATDVQHVFVRVCRKQHEAITSARTKSNHMVGHADVTVSGHLPTPNADARSREQRGNPQ